MTVPFLPPGRTALHLGLALALCLLVYWPGLYGAYIFDDFPFLVDNTDVHVRNAALGDWIRAAMSFPAAHQGRWLTMLTLGVNYWFTGLDPFWIKLTNVLIHLINGVLIYALLRTLFRLRDTCRGEVTDPAPQYWTALTIATCWLLLPINLTAVLYAVQRLESLSNLFVFAGLLWYLRARLRYAREGRSITAMAVALVVSTGLGVLAKESAVLLPLYTACVEFFVCRLRDPDGRWRKPVIGLYAALLVVPLAGGLVWLASWINSPTTYVRQFTTVQRLLTEARVLVDYLHWTLLPSGKVASLYHDDIAISQGLFTPPTTALSLLLLAALGASTFWLARRRPLAALGIAWFFAGHMLTATIIPLELVFEHRNYFASCGVLLTVAALLALEPTRRLNPRALAAVAAAFIAFYALQTALRAREWAHPVKLALSEVSNNPRSPRAHYEFARTLMVSPQFGTNQVLTQRALDGLTTCAALPRSSILCEQGTIVVSSRLGLPIADSVWQSLLAKLRAAPPSDSDVNALTELSNCQIHAVCATDERLLEAMRAAGSIVTHQPRLDMVMAGYLWKLKNARTQAEQLIRSAIASEPHDPAYRAYLIELLVEDGQIEAARRALEELRQLDKLGSLAYMLEPLTLLIETQSAAPPAG